MYLFSNKNKNSPRAPLQGFSPATSWEPRGSGSDVGVKHATSAGEAGITAPNRPARGFPFRVRARESTSPATSWESRGSGNDVGVKHATSAGRQGRNIGGGLIFHWFPRLGLTNFQESEQKFQPFVKRQYLILVFCNSTLSCTS